MTREVALKTCPFCEAPARGTFKVPGGAVFLYTPRHGEKCPLREGVYYLSEQEAADAWNNRSSGWQISTAPKDGTVIWAVLHADIYPRLRPTREDLEMWNGVQVPLRHPGVYEKDGRTWDHGWNIAAPVGNGGFPDEWIAGWMPLPSSPSGAK